MCAGRISTIEPIKQAWQMDGIDLRSSVDHRNANVVTFAIGCLHYALGDLDSDR